MWMTQSCSPGYVVATSTPYESDAPRRRYPVGYGPAHENALAGGIEMLRVGLTGGIGSGKSEVSRRLAAHGAVIIDADVAAREVVVPGSPGLARIAEAFGDEVLRPDGSLDRDRLGRIVFGDAELRAR